MDHTEAVSQTAPQTTLDIGLNGQAHAMAHVAMPIIDILNAYREHSGNAGALYGGLYAMGCALATMNIPMGSPADMRHQLAPLLDGYKTMLQAKAQSH